MTVGDLVVNLGLNRTGLTTGIGKALGELSSMGGRFKGVLGGVYGQLAALAGVGAFGAMAASAMKAVDETSELALSIGTTSEKLIGLQHAAALGGGSVESLNASMRKMLQNLSNAGDGGGVSDLLKEMGLSAKELQSMDSSEAFVRIADGISQMKNPSDQAAAAMKIFGKSAVEMLPMLQGGEAGIRSMMDEARTLGKTFSDLDAQDVAEANDAIDRLRAAVMGLFQSVAIAGAPFIRDFADGLRGLVPSSATLSETFSYIGTLFRQLVPIIGGFVVALTTITTVQKTIAIGQALILSLGGPVGWGTLAIGAGIAAGAYLAIDSALGGVTDALPQTTAAVADLNTETGKIVAPDEELDKLAKGSDRVKDRILSLRNELQMMATPEHLQGFLKIGQELDELAKGGANKAELDQLQQLMIARENMLQLQKQQTAEQDRLNSLAGDLQSKLDGLRSPFQVYQDELDQLKQGLAEGLIDEGEFKKLAMNSFQQSEKDSQKEKPPTDGGPAAARAGSVEAYRLVTQAGMDQQAAREKAADRKLQRDIAKRQETKLDALIEAVKGNKVSIEEYDV